MLCVMYKKMHDMYGLYTYRADTYIYIKKKDFLPFITSEVILLYKWHHKLVYKNSTLIYRAYYIHA